MKILRIEAIRIISLYGKVVILPTSNTEGANFEYELCMVSVWPLWVDVDVVDLDWDGYGLNNQCLILCFRFLDLLWTSNGFRRSL